FVFAPVFESRGKIGDLACERFVPLGQALPVAKLPRNGLQGIVQGLPGQGRGFVGALRGRLVGLAGRESGGDSRLAVGAFGLKGIEVDLGPERFKSGLDAYELFVERLGRSCGNRELLELSLAPDERRARRDCLCAGLLAALAGALERGLLALIGLSDGT